MTRKSKREIERALGDLDADKGRDSVEVVWEDDQTGEYVTRDGEPADPDLGADVVVVISETVVMNRDRAEQVDGWEILGPAEDVPEENDAVRVAKAGGGGDE